MKLHIFSDLHTENATYCLQNVEADVTIAAGDIISASHHASFAILKRLVEEAGRPFLYVPGNHEYYGGWFGWLQARVQKEQIPNLHLLDNGTRVINGVKFIGSTLWANVINDPSDPRYPCNIRSYRGLTRVENATEFIELVINDFHAIKIKEHRKKDRLFTVKDMNELNKKAEEFLKQEIASGAEKKVVITHFPPSFKSQHPRFAGDQANDYFMNAKDHLFPGVDLWIHGHTHMPCSYQVGQTNVVCNPRGYPRIDPQGRATWENPSFNEKLVIEV